MSFKNKESKKINDLIFKELIKRGYSLEGNTRIWNIADSKLWYLTPEQAQAYLDAEGSEQYRLAITDRGTKLIKDNINEILEMLGNEPINIIDLGCGDGIRAVHLINFFKDKIKLRYCPIDISGYMVQKAIETFSKLNSGSEIIDFKYNISDFENLENVIPLLGKNNYNKNFFFLLGNTLGNFEINDLLYKIRSNMKEGDLLIVGAGVYNKDVEKLAESYEKNVNINKFLLHIPLQLGLNNEDVVFKTRFINQRIEFYYTLKKEKVIKFRDKKIDFKEGDQIIVAVAYKHDKDDILTYFNLYFDQVFIRFSEDNSHVLAICKK